MSPRRRHLFNRLPARLALAAAAVLGPVTVARCRGTQEAPAAQPPPPPSGEVRLEPDSPKLAYISVDTVLPRTERVVAVLPAQLVPNEDHTVHVATPVAGRVRTLEVQLGDRVRAGQALARIASSDVAQAQSELLKAEASLTQATTALARARDLYQSTVIALKDLQQAESDEAQARAERDRAAARVKLLGAGSTTVGQEYVLRAPIGGEIVERAINVGAEVRPDNAQTLITISALDTLWLTASAYQRDLASAKKGDKLVFTTDAAPGRRFTATVNYVSNVLDPQTRTATIRAVLPNSDHALRTQVFGEARLLAPDTARVPVVPVEALVTRGSTTVVYVEAAPGRFVRRPVSVGEDDGQVAAITSGLRLGERVVTRGSLLLDADASESR